ncbi:MAG: phosphoserine phosphatase SerB [Alphaproteobacteria bacterium]|nr:phosphoserine phosphatase SerB [Alphaproteobacteria bacterium]
MASEIPTHVITLVALPSQGKTLTQGALDAACDAAAAAGFTPTKPLWLEAGEAADIGLYANGGTSIAIDEAGVDAILQPLDGFRHRRLLVSDMDSTIIQQECIDELADELGLKPQVSEITERAMNGELDFKAALRERVALLKGLEVAALERVYTDRITLMPGAKTLVQTMREDGAQCLLVSGGFTYFTERVRRAVGFHADHANTLNLHAGALDGTVLEPILDKESKLASLKGAAAQMGIPLEATLALGDGANDLPMLQAAGLGIAYHAKPSVRAAAKACIDHGDLTVALFAQGYRRSDWVE